MDWDCSEHVLWKSGRLCITESSPNGASITLHLIRFPLPHSCTFFITLILFFWITPVKVLLSNCSACVYKHNRLQSIYLDSGDFVNLLLNLDSSRIICISGVCVILHSESRVLFFHIQFLFLLFFVASSYQLEPQLWF